MQPSTKLKGKPPVIEVEVDGKFISNKAFLRLVEAGKSL